MKKAVLLINLGAPDSIEAIQPFLYNFFSDKEIVQLPFQKRTASLLSIIRARMVRKKYEFIGGKSPLSEITNKQAKALEKKLNIKIYVGMRYWHPSIEDAVKKMIIDGVEKVVALPLFPQYSKVTTGSCIKELNRVTARKTLGLALVNSWYENPIYLDALAQKIKEASTQFPRPNEVKMIFSAHAIPQRLVKEGDPYIEHLKGTISGVLERLGQVSWQLAFQSQHGPIKWTGPKTASIIKKLAKENQILIIPISFVSDHLETLYEIDVEYKRLAKKFGAKYFARAPSLNVSPRFIDALADISKSALSRFH